MMAWGGFLATTGFHYSAVDQSMRFTPEPGIYFWSNGYQYGTIEIGTRYGQKTASLRVLNGSIELRSFQLKGYGKVTFPNGKTFKENEPTILTIEKSN